MSACLVVLVALTFTLTGVVEAKQSVTPNPRVISQEDQIVTTDQSNRPIDIQTTKRIRTELMKDETLSMKAKNIKIITFNNGVTLKGDVKNAEEREKILKHAYTTAPKHRIYNQLTVVK